MKSPFKFRDYSKYNPANNKLLVSAYIYTPYKLSMRQDINDNEFTLEYRVEL